MKKLCRALDSIGAFLLIADLIVGCVLIVAGWEDPPNWLFVPLILAVACFFVSFLMQTRSA